MIARQASPSPIASQQRTAPAGSRAWDLRATPSGVLETRQPLIPRTPGCRTGLVIRLITAIGIASRRDAERLNKGGLKEGGANSAAMEKRWKTETQADFSGAAEIKSNTGQSLAETLKVVMGAVWPRT